MKTTKEVLETILERSKQIRVFVIDEYDYENSAYQEGYLDGIQAIEMIIQNIVEDETNEKELQILQEQIRKGIGN